MPDNYQNNITTLARRLKPFIMSTAMVAQATQAVKIIVHHRDGAPAEYFDVDDTGWDLAAAALRDWDTMVSPPALFEAVHTVPDNVTYLGQGPTSTVHTATLTFGPSCVGMNLASLISGDDANEHIAIVGPASGTAWINTINIIVNNAGAGAATGIKTLGGFLVARVCSATVTTQGAGMAAAITINEGGNFWSKQCDWLGWAYGEGALGYGGYCSNGDADLWDGSCLGSTKSFYRSTG